MASGEEEDDAERGNDEAEDGDYGVGEEKEACGGLWDWKVASC